MLRRSGALAALAATALAGCGVAGIGDAEEEKIPQGPPAEVTYGFSDNAVRAGQVSAARDAALTARGGGKISRITLDWRNAERQPGRYRLRDYDRIYRALLRRGVRPMWAILFAPTWAWERGTTCSGDCRFPPGKQALDEWAKFVALVARRYPRSAAIEIWNEPNVKAFWQPEADPAAYMRLLRTGYRAAKRVRPRMKVIMGGLSNNGHTDGEGNISIEDFTRALYDRGLEDFTDALAFHPYDVSKNDPQLNRSVNDVLEVRREFQDGMLPLWVNELGVTTSGTDPATRFSEEEQEDALVEAYEKLRRVPDVEMVLVHTLLDPAGDDSNPETGYGLLHADGAEKPAFCALARRVANRRC